MPLISIPETILTIVLEYMTYISRNKKPKIMRPLVNSDLKSSIEHVDKLFFTHFIDEALWKGHLYDIILAADFLDIGSLLKLSVARLACLLKNRTVESLRSIFGITDHGFEPDEYQEILVEGELATRLRDIQQNNLLDLSESERKKMTLKSLPSFSH